MRNRTGINTDYCSASARRTSRTHASTTQHQAGCSAAHPPPKTDKWQEDDVTRMPVSQHGRIEVKHSKQGSPRVFGPLHVSSRTPANPPPQRLRFRWTFLRTFVHPPAQQQPTASQEHASSELFTSDHPPASVRTILVRTGYHTKCRCQVRLERDEGKAGRSISPCRLGRGSFSQSNWRRWRSRALSKVSVKKRGKVHVAHSLRLF